MTIRYLINRGGDHDMMDEDMERAESESEANDWDEASDSGSGEAKVVVTDHLGGNPKSVHSGADQKTVIKADVLIVAEDVGDIVDGMKARHMEDDDE
jgi:hypothetical protein